MIARSCVLLLAAIILLAPGLSARTCIAQDYHQVERTYQDLVRSVVRIETRYASIFAPPGAGSGVVIGDDGLIATADHVLDGASEIWVVHPGEQRQRAAIVKRAPERDLALIRIEDDGSLVPITPHHRAVRPGQCVLALGNVMSWGIGIFAGIVSLSTCAEGCPAGATSGILTDITTPPGLSGGALVACADRSLVGIISFGLVALNSAAPTAGIVGAVPAAAVAKLLSEQLACAGGPHCFSGAPAAPQASSVVSETPSAARRASHGLGR
jgi:S1-C subfamily serine protease